MYFLLILFFGSLLGIIFMIGRKLATLPSGRIISKEETILKVPYLDEWRYEVGRGIKKHGYNGLVATIRFYVRSTNYILNKYEQLKNKVKDLRSKKLGDDSAEKREISKFLKNISEYKEKIRKIKHRIKEEEKHS